MQLWRARSAGVSGGGWRRKYAGVAAGRLTPVLERYAVEGRPLSVVYPPTRHVPQKLRVMIDFLVEITRLPPAAERALHARRRAATRS